MEIQTEVLIGRSKLPRTSDQISRSNGTVVIGFSGVPRSDPLIDTGEKIPQGLAKRLHRYALERMDDAGFATAVTGWKVTVYTINGEERAAHRAYTVRFQNERGGLIEVCGIFTRNGWPTLDHGFDCNHEKIRS